MTTILDVNIAPTSYSQATQTIIEWAENNERRYVCAANVHMVMEAHDSHTFCRVVNDADLVTPDGMPLVWVMRLKGARNQERVYGPTLMLKVIELAQDKGIPIGLFGSTQDILQNLEKRILEIYPGLKILYSESPPFRPATGDEDKLIIDKIGASGARIVFVALGCPKQEIWMSEHKDKVPAVLIGVGAAFDFHSGVIPQSPEFLQHLGLEWLFRLIHEPGRLWKRYFYHNPRFIALAMADILGIYHSQKFQKFKTE